MGKIIEVTVNGYKATLSIECEECITVIERDNNYPVEKVNMNTNKKHIKHKNHSFLGIMLIVGILMFSIIGCKNNDNEIYSDEVGLISNLEFDSDIYKMEMSMPDFVCYKDTTSNDVTNLIVVSKVTDEIYNNPTKSIPVVEGNENAIVSIPKEEIPNELFDDVAYDYEADEVKMNLFYYKDVENNLYSIIYSTSVDNFDKYKSMTYNELSKLKFI